MSSVGQYGVREPSVLGGMSLADLLDADERPEGACEEGKVGHERELTSLLQKPNDNDFDEEPLPNSRAPTPSPTGLEPQAEPNMLQEDEATTVRVPMSAPLLSLGAATKRREIYYNIRQYDTESEASTTATKLEIKNALLNIQPQPTEPAPVHRPRTSSHQEPPSLPVASTSAIAEVILQDAGEPKMSAPLPPPPLRVREYLSLRPKDITPKVGNRGDRFLSTESVMPVKGTQAGIPVAYVPPPEYSVPLGSAHRVALRPDDYYSRTPHRRHVQDPPHIVKPSRRLSDVHSPATSPMRVERDKYVLGSPLSGRALLPPDDDVSSVPVTPLRHHAPYGGTDSPLVLSPQPPNAQVPRDAPSFSITENEKLFEHVWDQGKPSPKKTLHQPFRVCTDTSEVAETVIVIDDNIVESPTYTYKTTPPRPKTSAKGPPTRLPNNVSVSPVIRTPVPLRTPQHEEIVYEGDLRSPSMSSPAEHPTADASPSVSEGDMALASMSPSQSPYRLMRPDFVSPSMGRAASAAPPPVTPPCTMEGSKTRSPSPVHIPFGQKSLPNITIPNTLGDDVTFTLNEGVLLVASESTPQQKVTKADWNEDASTVDLVGTGYTVSLAKGEGTLLLKLRPMFENGNVDHNVPPMNPAGSKRRVRVEEPPATVTPEGARRMPEVVIEVDDNEDIAEPQQPTTGTQQPTIGTQPVSGTIKQPAPPGKVQAKNEMENEVARQPDHLPDRGKEKEEEKEKEKEKSGKCCPCLVM